MYHEEDSDLDRFYRRLVAIIVVSTFLLYVGVWHIARTSYLESVRVKAKTYVDIVSTFREWNTNNEGIWIAGRADLQDNSYLRSRGIDDETRTVDGQKLTLMDPYTMIGEIAELTTGKDSIRFRLISATPIDPSNSPDAWESTALDAVDHGAEFYESFIETAGGGMDYRFVKPLPAQRFCLECHATPNPMGSGVNIGAFSITLPAENLSATLRNLTFLLLAAWITTVGVTLLLVRIMMSRLKAELQSINQDLRRAATIDQLTGLANRQLTLARLNEEFERSKRSGSPLSIAEFDLDYFKSVNDTHGHLVGDKVLRHFAERGHSVIRPYDILGRIGGEEFLLIAPNSDLEVASALAERVLDAFRSDSVMHQGAPLRTTASAGVATLAESDEEPEFLLERADQALYRAKQDGRDRVRKSEA